MSSGSANVELEEVYEHPEHGRVRVVELPEDDRKSAWVYPLDGNDEWEIKVARDALTSIDDSEDP